VERCYRVIVDVHSVQGGVYGCRADLDCDQRIEAPDCSFKGGEPQVLIREHTVTWRVVIDAQSDSRLETDEYGTGHNTGGGGLGGV
jgi:hypothetical protein